MTPLKTQAIQTALIGDWNNAVALNQLILEENPDDIDALNRLAFAYASLGNIKEAKSLYHKVLGTDAQNPIALRNLKRLSITSSKNIPTNFSLPVNNLFIEEPGKTKVIELINVAEQKIISQLRNGEYITLSPKRMKIFLLDNDKQYIGMLPDDIGRRLLRFIDGGNTYDAYVKTVSNHKVIIFVRELKRASRFKNQPSFMSSDKSRLSFDDEIKGSKSGSKQKSDTKNIREDEEDDHDSSATDDSAEESF